MNMDKTNESLQTYTCPECSGAGRTHKAKREGTGRIWLSITCDICKGKGEIKIKETSTDYTEIIWEK